MSGPGRDEAVNDRAKILHRLIAHRLAGEPNLSAAALSRLAASDGGPML
jgi:hypothetical protein